MNQKGFINIIVIVIVVILAGAGAYFVLNQQAQLTPTPTPTPTWRAPASGPITVNGEITCLPKKGTGSQTRECAIGLKDFDGRYYGLKDLFKFDPEYKFSVGGLRVEVSGSFNPEEMKGHDGNKYDVVGTINVISIRKVEGSDESNTATIQPGDPNKDGLAPFPDLPLSSLPQQPLSIKFVVEHRSALNGRTILTSGVIVGTLLGEKACPPDRGMCAQPSIFLADTAGENRNKLYDLRVIVGEEEQEKSYPIGKTIGLQVVIDGSKVAVIARKTY